MGRGVKGGCLFSSAALLASVLHFSLGYTLKSVQWFQFVTVYFDRCALAENTDRDNELCLALAVEDLAFHTLQRA